MKIFVKCHRVAGTSHRRRSQVRGGLGLLPVFLLGALGDARAQEAPPDDGPDNVLPVVGAETQGFGHDVSADGNFVLPIQFDLPAARQGLTPNIGLHYSSGVGNGMAGVGWTLRGLPAIIDRGDAAFFLPDGWGTAPNNNHRLLRSVFQSASGPFHTALDGGQRFEAFGTCGEGPCYWTMRDGKGHKYFFGEVVPNRQALTYTASPCINTTGYSIICAPRSDPSTSNPKRIRAWLLSKVVDLKGNNYTVAYHDGGAGSSSGVRLPLSLRYNNHASHTGSTRQVTFGYQTRPDYTPMPNRHRHRLGFVEIEARQQAAQGGARIGFHRRYTFDYDTSPSSGRSRLRSMAECGGYEGAVPSGPVDCLPPQRFEYSEDGTEVDGSPLAVGSVLSAYQTTATPPDVYGDAWQLLRADINGDGYDDVVRVLLYQPSGEGAGSLAQVFEGNSTGVGGTYTHSWPAHTPEEILVRFARAGDFDGDGFDDLALFELPDTLHDDHARNYSVAVQIAHGSSTGLSADLQETVVQLSLSPWSSLSTDFHWLGRSWDVLVHDWNGDGAADIHVFCGFTHSDYSGLAVGPVLLTGQSRFPANDGSSRPSLSAPIRPINPALPAHETEFVGLRRLDSDGDFKDEVEAVFVDGSDYIVAQYRNGTFATTLSAGVAAYRGATMATVGDLNGDGFSDTLLGVTGGRSSSSRTLLRRHGGTGTSGFVADLVNASTPSSGGGYACHRERLNQDHQRVWDVGFVNHVLVDFNGDGIDDFISDYVGINGAEMNTYLFGPTGAFIASTPSSDPSFIVYKQLGAFLDATPRRPLFGDFNGDGNADIAFVSGYSQYGDVGGVGSVRLGTSDASSANGFRPDLGKLLAPFPAWVGPTQGADNGLVLDFNGDGRDDVVYIRPRLAEETSSQFDSLWFLSDGTRPDLLNKATLPLGGVLRPTYTPSIHVANLDNERYRSWGWCTAKLEGSNSVGHTTSSHCGLPDRSRRPLVTTVHVHDPLQASLPSTRTYEYYNPRIFIGSRYRRNSLGFEQVTVTDTRSGATTNRVMRQDLPFAGVVVSSEVLENRNAARVSVVKTTHEAWSGWGSLSQPLDDYQNSPTRVVQTQVAENRYEGGVVAHRVTSSILYDAFGMPLTVTTCGDPADGGFCMEQRNLNEFWEAEWVGRTTKVALTSDGKPLDVRRTTFAPIGPDYLLSKKVERILFEDEDLAVCSGTPQQLAEWCSSASGARWVTISSLHVHDAFGNLKSYKDVRGFTHSVTYDTASNTLQADATNPLGHITRSAYDSSGRLKARTDLANGVVEEYRYDSLGRPTFLLRPRPIGSPGPAPVASERRYEDWGTLGSQKISDRIYSQAGLAPFVSETHLGGLGEKYFVLNTLTPGPLFSGPHTQQSFLREWEMDKRKISSGRPRFGSSPTQTMHEEILDARDRAIESSEVTRDLSGNTVTTRLLATRVFGSSKAGSSFEQISNPDEGDRKLVRDFRGKITTAIGADGQPTQFIYSRSGNLKRVVLPGDGELVYKNDSWGRRRTESDPQTGTIKFFYDDASNRWKTENAAGESVVYTFDALNRPTSRGAGLGSAIPVDTKFYYDSYPSGPGTFAVGKLTRVTDPSGEQIFVYDIDGNVTHRDRWLGGDGPFLSKWTYDWRGKVVERVYPDASRVFYGYSPEGALEKVDFDAGAGRQTVAQFRNYDAEMRARYRLIAPGNLKIETTLQFEDPFKAGWLSSMVTKRIGGEELQNITYTYDQRGNIKTVSDRRPESLKNRGGISTDQSEVFNYDERLQLTDSTGSPTRPPLAFRYSSFGDVEEMEATFGTPSSCPAARCLEGTVAGMGTMLVEYDAAGRSTAIRDDGVGRSLTLRYDTLGRLESVKGNSSVLESKYRYDYSGARVERTSYFHGGPGVVRTVRHRWIEPEYELVESSDDPGLVSTTLEIRTPGGQPLASVTYGGGLTGAPSSSSLVGDAAFCMTDVSTLGRPDGMLYYLGDHRHSVDSVVDSQGNEVAHYFNHPYGENLRSACDSGARFGSVGTDVALNGFERAGVEPDFGLVHMGARYYYPRLGRFISPDSIVTGTGYDPRDYNRYMFARNNPIGRWDPTGFEDQDVLDFIADGGIVEVGASASEKGDEAFIKSANGALIAGATLGIATAGLALAPEYLTAGLALAAVGKSTAEPEMAFGLLLGPLLATMRYSGRTAVLATDSAEAAPRMFSDLDVLAQYGRSVPAESGGFLNVVTHADANVAWVLRGGQWSSVSHRSLAKYIQGLPEYYGQPIRLLACNAGACPTGLAQNLANKLGVPVQASPSRVLVYQNGNFSAPSWQNFTPRN